VAQNLYLLLRMICPQWSDCNIAHGTRSPDGTIPSSAVQRSATLAGIERVEAEGFILRAPQPKPMFFSYWTNHAMGWVILTSHEPELAAHFNLRFSVAVYG
jgi:hypothetical protein